MLSQSDGGSKIKTNLFYVYVFLEPSVFESNGQTHLQKRGGWDSACVCVCVIFHIAVASSIIVINEAS